VYRSALVGTCSLAGTLLRVWNAGKEAERGLNMPLVTRKLLPIGSMDGNPMARRIRHQPEPTPVSTGY
jgi:hypothetical protein